MKDLCLLYSELPSFHHSQASFTHWPPCKHEDFTLLLTCSTVACKQSDHWHLSCFWSIHQEQHLRGPKGKHSGYGSCLYLAPSHLSHGTKWSLGFTKNESWAQTHEEVWEHLDVALKPFKKLTSEKCTILSEWQSGESVWWTVYHGVIDTLYVLLSSSQEWSLSTEARSASEFHWKRPTIRIG